MKEGEVCGVGVPMVDVEKRAREIWDEREKRFPASCRMTWNEGTALARELALQQAQAELMLAAIESRKTAATFDDMAGALMALVDIQLAEKGPARRQAAATAWAEASRLVAILRGQGL